MPRNIQPTVNRFNAALTKAEKAIEAALVRALSETEREAIQGALTDVMDVAYKLGKTVGLVDGPAPAKPADKPKVVQLTIAAGPDRDAIVALRSDGTLWTADLGNSGRLASGNWTQLPLPEG